MSRITIGSRTRYPTDAEYDAVYEQAPEGLQICMEIAYLCRLRSSEVVGTDFKDKHKHSAPGVLRQHMENAGLRVIRGKGSKTQVVAWTP